jgi:hypothetical protein
MSKSMRSCGAAWLTQAEAFVCAVDEEDEDEDGAPGTREVEEEEEACSASSAP